MGGAGWACVFWLVAWCGCAGLPPVPDKGGPPWLRVETAHFVLFSDLDVSDASDTIQTFERLLDGYSKLGWQAQGELPVKLHVVVFAERSHFEVFAPLEVEGYYVHFGALEPLVVMRNQGQLDRFRTLKHELTHHIAYQALPFQPRWFSEGLASYFETASFDDEQRFAVGAPPRELVRALGEYGRLRASELFASEAVDLSPRFYATSWLLVHYLMSHRADAFVRYQDGLEAGLSHDAAWAAAFPQLSPERVDALLAEYYAAGQYAFLLQPMAAYAGAAPQARALGSAEVHALRAQLFRSCPACGPDEHRIAEQHVADALRLEPNNLRASVLRIMKAPKQDQLPMAQALSAAHPAAAIAWFMRGLAELGSTEPARCTPETAARLRELGSTSAHALMLAATCQARAGDGASARQLSARASRRQPADTSLLVMHAEVARAIGDCAELDGLVARLRSALHPRVDPKLIASFETCRSATAATSPPPAAPASAAP